MNRLNAEQLAGAAAGRAVTAWMVTDQIEDLVVLRADRLSGGRLELAARVVPGNRQPGAAGLRHTRRDPRAPERRPGRYRLPAAYRAAAGLRAAGPRPPSRPDGAAGAGPDAAYRHGR